MRLKNVFFATLTVLLLAPMAATGSADTPDPETEAARNLAYARIKVWLEGAYSGSTMTTSLNPTYLPLSQPYADAAFDGTPMDYDGTESVASWGGALATAVDWVVVELRTTTAPGSVVAMGTRAGILMSDGLIRDVDGTSDLVFQVAAGDYFVVVRHRNHIPIMSNTVVTLSGTAPATLYDMTVEGNIYSGVGAGGAKDLGSGAFGLFTGDANGSGGTGPEDQAAWLGVNGFTGYLLGDFNLSSGAGPEDQALWLGNPSKSTLVPES